MVSYVKERTASRTLDVLMSPALAEEARTWEKPPQPPASPRPQESTREEPGKAPRVRFNLD
jgi:hypothetical protein